MADKNHKASDEATLFEEKQAGTEKQASERSVQPEAQSGVVEREAQLDPAGLQTEEGANVEAPEEEAATAEAQAFNVDEASGEAEAEPEASNDPLADDASPEASSGGDDGNDDQDDASTDPDDSDGPVVIEIKSDESKTLDISQPPAGAALETDDAGDLLIVESGTAGEGGEAHEDESAAGEVSAGEQAEAPVQVDPDDLAAEEDDTDESPEVPDPLNSDDVVAGEVSLDEHAEAPQQTDPDDLGGEEGETAQEGEDANASGSGPVLIGKQIVANPNLADARPPVAPSISSDKEDQQVDKGDLIEKPVVAEEPDPAIAPTLGVAMNVQPVASAPTLDVFDVAQAGDADIDDPTRTGPEGGVMSRITGQQPGVGAENLVVEDATVAGIEQETETREASETAPDEPGTPSARDLQDDVNVDTVDPFEVKGDPSSTETQGPPTDFDTGDATSAFTDLLPDAADVKGSTANPADPGTQQRGQGGAADLADVASGKAAHTHTTEFDDGGEMAASRMDDGSTQIVITDPDGTTMITEMSSDGAHSTTNVFDPSGQLTQSETTSRDDGTTTTETQYHGEDSEVKRKVTTTNKDGSSVTETYYADGSVREEHSDGTVIIYHSDGRVTVMESGGDGSDADSGDDGDDSGDSDTDESGSEDDSGDGDDVDAGQTGEEEAADSYDENYVDPDEAIARFGDSYIRMKETIREVSDVRPVPEGVEAAEASGPPAWVIEGVTDPPDGDTAAPAEGSVPDEPLVAGDDAGAIDFGPDHVDENQPTASDPRLTEDRADQAGGDAAASRQFDDVRVAEDDATPDAGTLHNEIWNAISGAGRSVPGKTFPLDNPDDRVKGADTFDIDQPIIGYTAGAAGKSDEAEVETDDFDQDEDF